MKRLAYFAVVLFAMVLVSGSVSGAWWDDTYLFKRPINFTAQPYEIGTTFQIEWSSNEFGEAQSDLDDLRIIDESDMTDVNRSCEGTDADGNCFFRLQRSIGSGESNIYAYYGNVGVTMPEYYGLDTNAYGSESGETPPPGTAGGSVTSLESRFGIASRLLEGVQNYTVTGAGLGASSYDYNYSTWMFLAKEGAVNLTDLMILDSANQTICRIGMRQSTSKWSHNGSVDTGYVRDLNIWYNVQIDYTDGGTTCFYTIRRINSNGDLNSFVYVGSFDDAAGGPWTVDRTYISSNKALTVSFFDNFSTGLPTAISSLGAEEAGGTLNTDVNDWRVEGFDPNTTEFPSFSYVVDGNLTLDFNVFNSDDNRMFVDINYSSSDSEGTGTVIIEDLNLSDIMCDGLIFDRDGNSCTWDWNISVVPDGNYYILYDVNSGGVGGVWNTNFEATPKSFRIRSPTIKMRFLDENTGLPLVGLSVEAEGNVITTNSTGEADINIAATSGTLVVRAWDDNNYGNRFFEFDINSNTDIDANCLMLAYGDGIDYNFTWYDTDETTLLSNQRFFVYNATDGNYVSIRTTDSSARTSFFLHPDQNYYFITSTGRFDRIYTTFKVPKDEDSLITISPYNLRITGLADLNFVGLTGDITTYLFPNTADYYRFDVNGGVNYYPREREINYRGNPLTATIQMYLTRITDSVLPVIYTKDAADLSPVPNITIRVYKTIVGEGVVEVETVVTDDAGTATLSFIIDDEYQFDFYDADGDFLFTKNLRPNFTAYYVYIDTGAATWEETTIEYINISGLPTVGYISYTPGIGYDVNITVDVNNGTIAVSWFSITNDDGNVTFNTSCGAGCGYTIETVDMNNTGAVKVTVYVETASGLTLTKSWSFSPFDSSAYNFIDTLKSTAFREEWGCSADTNEPCFFLLMVSAMLTIGMIAAAGTGITTNRGALGIVAMLGLSIFTYLTWIPISFFVLACLAAFASLILSRRGM